MLGLSSGDVEIEYDFVTEQGQVAVGDSVKAIFVNRSTETVFIFPECPLAGIEKRTDSSWREIELSPPVACVPGFPRPAESGNRFAPVLEPWILEDAAVEPGIYRLTLVVGPKRTREETEPQRITSNRFEIVQ